MSDEKPMGQVIQIDEARIRDHLGEMVRGTVEETLNAMLDAEADQLCGAGRYERSKARQDTRAGPKPLVFQCRLLAMTPYLAELARRRPTSPSPPDLTIVRPESAKKESARRKLTNTDHATTPLAGGATDTAQAASGLISTA